MEFGEKLLNMRKGRGLTQEELAQALYVSRTAVSKWESGRGYPSIDSLKGIAEYFSVTVDELLSSDDLLSIAEKENRTNIRRMCDLLFSVVDIFSFMLMILPLYPMESEGIFYSVNIFDYMRTAPTMGLMYSALIILLILCGVIKLILLQTKREKSQSFLTAFSMCVSIFSVIFFALSRQVYSVVLVFLFMIAKGLLLLKYTRKGK